MQLKIEKNVPYTKGQKKELTAALKTLKDGDSVFLEFKDFQKTTIRNSVFVAKQTLCFSGLTLKTESNHSGTRVWCFKIQGKQ